jgi:hypothetical protein
VPTFIEKLHDTASAKHNGVEWTPGEKTGHGKLIIEMGQGRGGGKRSRVCYAVGEFAASWDIPGRAFHFVKLAEGGTDPTSNTEDVFVASNGQDRTCSCKGFAYARGKDKEGRTTCKHLEAVLSLLENRWV